MTTPKLVARHRAALLIAAGAASILLGGCSRTAPEPAEEKSTTVSEAPPTPAPAPTRVPPPEKTARIDVPPAEEPAPAEQMQDDADATGMTAHVSHDEAATDNMDAPDEPAKQD